MLTLPYHLGLSKRSGILLTRLLSNLSILGSLSISKLATEPITALNYTTEETTGMCFRSPRFALQNIEADRV